MGAVLPDTTKIAFQVVFTVITSCIRLDRCLGFPLSKTLLVILVCLCFHYLDFFAAGFIPIMS